MASTSASSATRPCCTGGTRRGAGPGQDRHPEHGDRAERLRGGRRRQAPGVLLHRQRADARGRGKQNRPGPFGVGPCGLRLPLGAGCLGGAGRGGGFRQRGAEQGCHHNGSEHGPPAVAGPQGQRSDGSVRDHQALLRGAGLCHNLGGRPLASAVAVLCLRCGSPSGSPDGSPDSELKALHRVAVI